MPSLWRTPLNAGYRNSHGLQPRKPPTALLQALMSILLAPTRCSRKEAVTSISLTASTRASSLLRDRGAIVTRSTFVMSPNKHVSSADASNPIRIIFATCNHGRSAAKRATNSPSRSAARITARSIAPATNGHGGRRPASIPLRSLVSSGDKPGSMIRKNISRRISRRARRLDQLPRPLTVRGHRGPIRLPSTEPTTVARREQHGRPPQYCNGRPALSRKRRHRLCRSHHRRPPGNLAAARQALSGLAAPAILRTHLGCAEPWRAERSPQRV